MHHKFFLKHGIPSKHAQVLIIGSYRIGGAGKTPFCIWLAKEISTTGKKIAILCHSFAQDEYKLLQKKLPHCTIIATKNRYKTIHEIDLLFDIIICDDGFEDSRLWFASVICLNWGKEPKYLSDIFPIKNAKSFPKDHSNIKLHLQCHGKNADVVYSIQKINNVLGNEPDKNKENISLIAGIGDPQRFFLDIKTCGLNIKEYIQLQDHSKKLDKIAKKCIQEGKQVIITEKDACRISHKTQTNEQLFIAYQSIYITEDACKRIKAIFNT